MVREMGVHGSHVDGYRLGGEPGFRNLQPVTAVWQISERKRALRVCLKAALHSRRQAFQLPRSLHHGAGRILNLNADLTLRTLGLKHKSGEQHSRGADERSLGHPSR